MKTGPRRPLSINRAECPQCDRIIASMPLCTIMTAIPAMKSAATFAKAFDPAFPITFVTAPACEKTSQTRSMFASNDPRAQR
jgi:hypothetical protein